MCKKKALIKMNSAFRRKLNERSAASWRPLVMAHVRPWWFPVLGGRLLLNICRDLGLPKRVHSLTVQAVGEPRAFLWTLSGTREITELPSVWRSYVFEMYLRVGKSRQKEKGHVKSWEVYLTHGQCGVRGTCAINNSFITFDSPKT